MIKNHLIHLLIQNLNHPPTPGQTRLIDLLASYISEIKQDKVFLLKGFAGTGKTTVINSITQTLESLKIKTVLMAPTGRAAKVIAAYTHQPAYTIHKKIYRQQSSSDGMGRFFLNTNLYKNTWFIVDEASMISNESNEGSFFGSGRLLDDLLEFVYTGENCRLLLSGDVAQLPPVGMQLSPALNSGSFTENGFDVSEFELTDVVRQAEESGILFNATEIRKIITAAEPINHSFIHLEINRFEDVIPISGADLIETINTCYDRFGINETVVVTRSNKRANLFNSGIRNTILFRENELEKGDLLMVVKNNYFWLNENPEIDFIANGDIGQVISIYRYEEIYGFRFADVLLKLVDYENIEIECKIFLDTLKIEQASFSVEQMRQLFEAVSEDYTEIKNKRERWKKIRENPFYNALQVKFAYAITCHKAQGGQWDAVFIDHGYLTEDMLGTEYYRWLYTAFTRPVKRLYLVNFNSNFFG